MADFLAGFQRGPSQPSLLQGIELRITDGYRFRETDVGERGGNRIVRGIY